MAVIDRWLAAIDHLYTSNRHVFPRGSDGGHEFGSLEFGKRQSVTLRKLHPATLETARVSPNGSELPTRRPAPPPGRRGRGRASAGGRTWASRRAPRSAPGGRRGCCGGW